MWKLFSETMRLRIVVGMTLLLGWGFDALLGASNPLKWLALIVFIIGVALVGLANVSWRWAWVRWPSLNRWLFPDLNGEWKGHLMSTWVNPETHQTPPPIPVTIAIHQTFFKTSVTLATAESSSVSTRCFLEASREIGRFRVWYTYNNDPIAQVQHRSSPHEGVAWLEIDLSIPDQINGRYFTARRTTGDIEVYRLRDGFGGRRDQP